MLKDLLNKKAKVMNFMETISKMIIAEISEICQNLELFNFVQYYSIVSLLRRPGAPARALNMLDPRAGFPPAVAQVPESGRFVWVANLLRLERIPERCRSVEDLLGE